MDIDDFFESFPVLMSMVMDQKGHENDVRNVTKLTVTLMGYSVSSNEAVDKALYLYGRIKAGLRK